MLNVSSVSQSSTEDEDDLGIMAAPLKQKRDARNASTESTGVASRLAFTYDLSNLDEEGRPKKKVARRLSRNESEKMRRDKLNAYIAELARLVPLIFSSSRKLDKASILRLTVTYLRIYHDLIKSRRSGMKWMPDFLTAENLANALLESVDGFLLVVNQNGQLIFTTDAFTSTLGHSLVEVLGMSIFKLIHPEDKDVLRQQFKTVKETHQNNGCSGHRSFCLRMTAKVNKPTVCYKNIQIIGQMKVIPPPQATNIARSEPEVCLIGLAHVVSGEGIRELCPLPDSNAKQWITRHEMDGTITFSDQRGAWLTGFLPGESIGMPAYALVHPEDISSIVAVHNLMLTTGSVPVTVFRMFTKSRDVLYIRNNTHIVVDMWTSKPKYIISINEVIEEELGQSLLVEQRKVLKALPANCDSGAPSSVSSESSRGSTDDENSHSGNMKDLQKNDIAMPEIIPEGTGNLSIVVGNQKYEVLLADNEASIQMDNRDHSDCSWPVFDPDVHKDTGRKGIALVKPTFLGDKTEETGTSQNVYNDVNTYLGNDPVMLRLGFRCSKAYISQTSCFQHKTSHDPLTDSAISNLDGKPASSSSSCPQQHSSNTTQVECRQTTAAGNTPVTGYCEHHSVKTHRRYNNGCCPSALGAKQLVNVHVPSTSVRHNPMLVKLLNANTSLENHIRETRTSHLVTDISGMTGEKAHTTITNGRVSSTSPDEDQLTEGGLNSERKISNQHTANAIKSMNLDQLQYLAQQQQQQMMERTVDNQRTQVNDKQNCNQRTGNCQMTDCTYYMDRHLTGFKNGFSDMCQQTAVDRLNTFQERLFAHEGEINMLPVVYMRELEHLKPDCLVKMNCKSGDSHTSNTNIISHDVNTESIVTCSDDSIIMKNRSHSSNNQELWCQNCYSVVNLDQVCRCCGRYLSPHVLTTSQVDDVDVFKKAEGCWCQSARASQKAVPNPCQGH